MAFNLKLYNVIMLGLVFMFIFTAFQTSCIIETVVLRSVAKEDTSFTGNGYTSLAIIYAVFSVSNWIAPSAISYIGPKITMLIGGVVYSLFIASFLHPITYLLYIGSALLGFGAAILWTAQGNFLTINSDSETISRNSGIFWALLQSSLLIGNLFVFYAFAGETTIKASTRELVYYVLTAVACLGTLMIFLLKTPARDTNLLAIQADRAENGPLQALKRSFELLKTKEMIFLGHTFFYTGVELSFFSGIYGTCIGFTDRLDDAKRLVGLSGVFIGIGEIFGGALFGLLGKVTNKFGRDPVVILGFVVHMIAFYITFINLPSESPLHETSGFAYIETNKYLAILCSFLLGFGDSCFNTQIYSILGYMFPEDSAPAFALFKFVQSVAAAVAFFYSNHLALQWQLLILVLTGTIGTFTFLKIEWSVGKSSSQGYNQSISGSSSDE